MRSLRLVEAQKNRVRLPGAPPKATEAALITRREETAAMRMQANTARLMEGSPLLMRLRELEVLEKVAAYGKLNVVVGEKGLTDRITQLL